MLRLIPPAMRWSVGGYTTGIEFGMTTLTAESLNRLTSTIIDAAIRVHRALGPGLLERAYFECLCCEVETTGLRIETQKALPLVYRGVTVRCAYRADIIVEKAVVVE